MAVEELVVAMTGASGAAYGVRLVEVILRAGWRIHLVVSPSGCQVIEQELGRKLDLDHVDPAALLGSAARDVDLRLIRCHHFKDLRAGIASGSYLTAGMAVCPCSMGTLAAIAHGICENLIHRAADVHLKERRKLVLVPRETPLGLVQLRNLTSLAEAGAVILPAAPGFYHRPHRVEELVDFVEARVCDQLGVFHELVNRWGGENPEPPNSLR